MRRWRCRPSAPAASRCGPSRSWPTSPAAPTPPIRWGGAFVVERLTRDIEEAAEAYIRKIDDLGGSVAAVAFMQREIQDAAYRYQREVEDKARIVVGVNEFVTEDPPPANLFQLDAGIGEALAQRVARFRSEERRVGKECRSRWSP